MSEKDQAMDIGNMHKSLVKIAHGIPEISSRTDGQTQTTHHNTSLCLGSFAILNSSEQILSAKIVITIIRFT